MWNRCVNCCQIFKPPDPCPSDRAWMICWWCRHTQVVREVSLEAAFLTFKGFCIGAGFVTAAFIARELFNVK